MDGFIYLMSNPAYSLLKIGKSSKDPTKDRLEELSRHSGVPYNFKCEYFLCVSNYEEIEKNIHDCLSDLRPNPNREFFDISITEAKQIIKKQAGILGEIKYEEDFSERTYEEIDGFYIKKSFETDYERAFVKTLINILHLRQVSVAVGFSKLLPPHRLLLEAALWTADKVHHLPVFEKDVQGLEFSAAPTLDGERKEVKLYGTKTKKGQYWNLEKYYDPLVTTNKQNPPTRGVFFYKNGNVYDGPFEYGKRNGRGRFWYHNGKNREFFYCGDHYEDRLFGRGSQVNKVAYYGSQDIRTGRFEYKTPIE